MKKCEQKISILLSLIEKRNLQRPRGVLREFQNSLDFCDTFYLYQVTNRRNNIMSKFINFFLHTYLIIFLENY